MNNETWLKEQNIAAEKFDFGGRDGTTGMLVPMVTKWEDEDNATYATSMASARSSADWYDPDEVTTATEVARADAGAMEIPAAAVVMDDAKLAETTKSSETGNAPEAAAAEEAPAIARVMDTPASAAVMDYAMFVDT